jgi:hypothetical protein
MRPASASWPHHGQGNGPVMLHLLNLIMAVSFVEPPGYGD